jgi:hypothetical protein
MKKTLKKISLKKKTLVVLTGKEKQQAAGGFTNTCGPFTYTAPWRCVASAGFDC